MRTTFLSRLLALVVKEFNQIRRDRRLALSLVIPPTLQILLFGFALNSDVSNLRVGILDDSRTPESRELIAILTESRSFQFSGYYFEDRSLEAAVSRGALDAGVVIRYDFAKELQRSRPTSIQVVLNAVNANTAAIAQGYAEGVLADYNRKLAAQGIRAKASISASSVSRKGTVTLTPAFLFNPGLVTDWFIVTGVFGTLLILNGSIVASGAMIKEREAGTVEQLLMTPSGTAEIVIAKISPLLTLMFGTILLALGLIRFVFHVPMRGSPVLVFLGAILCLLCGIGIGTTIATFTKSAQQAQLLSFFVNPPLASLSGSLSPIEAMPKWMQPITILNPIRHFGVITRGVMVKGAGITELWPNFLALALFALILMSFSIWRFRKQLG